MSVPGGPDLAGVSHRLKESLLVYVTGDAAARARLAGARPGMRPRDGFRAETEHLRKTSPIFEQNSANPPSRQKTDDRVTQMRGGTLGC